MQLLLGDQRHDWSVEEEGVMPKLVWTTTEQRKLRKAFKEYAQSQQKGGRLKLRDAAAFVQSKAYPNSTTDTINGALRRFGIWRRTNERSTRTHNVRAGSAGQIVHAVQCPRCGVLFRVKRR